VEKQELTFSGRYLRMGGTHGITLPPRLRERMGFVHGDYVVYLLVGDVLRVRKVTPKMILQGEFFDGAQKSASEAK
jgi:antitoxin component of MazEF toxin-antitoxin module